MLLYVLFVSEWKMKSDSGDVMHGAKLHAINGEFVVTPSAPVRDSRGLVRYGDAPAIFSLDPEALNHLPPVLPALCECVVTTKRGKDGTAVVSLASIRPAEQAVYVKPVKASA